MKERLTRKITASLLVMVMMLMTLSTMVSAADASAASGTVNIYNYYEESSLTLDGKTFEAYKLFDLEINEETGSVEYYHVTDDFVPFFQGLLEVEDTGLELDEAARAYVLALGDATTALQDFVADVLTWLENANVAASYSTDEVTMVDEGGYEVVVMQDLAAGYYLIADASEAGDNAVVAGALNTVPYISVADGVVTYEDINIIIKGSQPTITKAVWHNDENVWDTVSDYQIGDIVDYKVTATLPTDITGYETYKYIIEDVMPDNITLTDVADDDLAIVEVYTSEDKSGQLVEGTDYTLETEDGGFSVVVTDMAKLMAKADELYVYFKGYVEEDMLAYDVAEVNTVSLTYSNNPYSTNDTNTVEASVKTYTFDLQVTKTEGNGVTPLAGATFKLYAQDTEGEWVEVYLAYYDDVEGVPTYVVADGIVSESASEDGSYEGMITTGETGVFNIKGLDDTIVYKIEEFEAPEGFNLAAPVEFKIAANYDATDGTEVVTVNSSGVVANNNELTLTIVNTSNQLLPETGGIGTTIFVIVGACMMLGAGVVLIKKRKTV